jgi:hypothetical protein
MGKTVVFSLQYCMAWSIYLALWHISHNPLKHLCSHKEKESENEEEYENEE